MDNSDFCFAHPNAAAHKLIAGQLIDFIDAVLPGFGAPAGAGNATAAAR